VDKGLISVSPKLIAERLI